MNKKAQGWQGPCGPVASRYQWSPESGPLERLARFQAGNFPFAGKEGVRKGLPIRSLDGRGSGRRF